MLKRHIRNSMTTIFLVKDFTIKVRLFLQEESRHFKYERIITVVYRVEVVLPKERKDALHRGWRGARPNSDRISKQWLYCCTVEQRNALDSRAFQLK